MASVETISHEAGRPEAWICLCHNTPTADGFYPCDREGNHVEPTPKEWTAGYYVCARCGRIIDPSTLAVIGRTAASEAVQ